MQGFLTNLVIFIVMGLGCAMKKSGKLSDSGLKDLNTLLFTLLMPVSFFSAGLGFNREMIQGWSFALVLLGAYIAATAAAWVLSGVTAKNPKRRAVAMVTGIRANVVFIGLPLMTLWLGKEGTEAQLVYIAILMPYINVVPLLMGQIALNGRADRTSVLKALVNTFKNPILLSGMLGLLLALLGWQSLIPQWVMRTVSVLGNCGNGLALIAIGATLVPENLLGNIREAWSDMLMKLVIHPAIVMAALLLFPLGNAVLARTAVVASAVPPAFNCFVLAKGFNMDGDYAAMLVASSTLMSMVTLLFWMELASRVFI